jgi:hypothetical protein
MGRMGPMGLVGGTTTLEGMVLEGEGMGFRRRRLRGAGGLSFLGGRRRR